MTIENGIITEIYYYIFPKGKIRLFFDRKGNLSEKFVSTDYGSIYKKWDGESKEIYHIHSPSRDIVVTKEEYMKNIDSLTLQIMKDTGMIKEVSNIVSKYLYP